MHPLGVAVPLAAGALATGPGQFVGISVHVATAAAAKVRLWDNASAASGTILGTYELTASGVGSFFDIMYGPGRRFENGLFLEIVSGTVEGSAFI